MDVCSLTFYIGCRVYLLRFIFGANAEFGFGCLKSSRGLKSVVDGAVRASRVMRCYIGAPRFYARFDLNIEQFFFIAL